MARKVFFSFHYAPDKWRASQVRQMGAIEGNAPLSDNDWESVKRGGDAAIERWINGQMDGKSCSIVLVGAQTSGRKWINYEIKRSWAEKKGLLGIHIHRLLDEKQNTAQRGSDPFAGFTVGNTALSSIVRLYDPNGSTSKDVYATIKANIESWVEEAIRIRANYS